jgi:hypothetical protein
MNITNADGVLDALCRKGGARSTTLDSDRPEALGLPSYGVEWYRDPAPRDEFQFFEGANGTPTVIIDIVGPKSERG